jgi:hypothetical protein
MQCLQCQHENPSAAKFCNQCGSPYAPMCSACGYENPAHAKFCNQCGTSLIADPSALNPVQSAQPGIESEVRFHTLLPVVMMWLQREGRLTYRTIKWTFVLDDAWLAEIREELTLRRLATDEAGKVLVWTGEAPAPPTAPHCGTA